MVTLSGYPVGRSHLLSLVLFLWNHRPVCAFVFRIRPLLHMFCAVLPGRAHVQGVLTVRGDFWSGDMADSTLMFMFAMMKPVVEVCRGDSSWRSRCIGSVLWPTCP